MSPRALRSVLNKMVEWGWGWETDRQIGDEPTFELALKRRLGTAIKAFLKTDKNVTGDQEILGHIKILAKIF